MGYYYCSFLSGILFYCYSLERGLQQEQALVLRQLTRKLGNIPTELPPQINSLSIEQLESLGEALLDFNAIADLENWLQKKL
jgi:Domain of unknown function (DUF4351)